MQRNLEQIKAEILNGETKIGIEFGSTRIKIVLIGKDYSPICDGSHSWENEFDNGFWTYSLDKIWGGLQDSYMNMIDNVKEKYGVVINKVKAIGISAMMHGYMVFDKDDKQLTPFRTWRNSTTLQASKELTTLFNFNIPQRWSIAHLYQAVLNGEKHVEKIDYLTTLAGYIHWRLTGSKVVGVGEASGIIPLENGQNKYNKKMMSIFNSIVDIKNMPWTLNDILPKILAAGENAGQLTVEGARLLDISGNLQSGIPFCPPEGDAETGMVATNSVVPKTGNVSAGTSIFAMIVLDKPLKGVHSEIDVVTTPSGKPVAMVHANNCSSDINSWVSIFEEFSNLLKLDNKKTDIYNLLFTLALNGDDDCGNMMAYNFYSGEHILGISEGRPLFVRKADSKFNLSNFMRMNFYSAFCVLKTGLNILLKEENVNIDRITAHGGLFKVKGVAQNFLADAINAPIAVLDTAGEGGAWGMALLAAYMFEKGTMSFEEFLENKVFTGKEYSLINPTEVGVNSFEKYYKSFYECLPIETQAIRSMK
ncbi:MAG: FGGY-family carbohydrate kinase [Candidatus Izemoplasmatales bacterium]|nr:FGGY-family carbohydrate kinase [Candidatus Izemoplasmatales bacterium]